MVLVKPHIFKAVVPLNLILILIAAFALTHSEAAQTRRGPRITTELTDAVNAFQFSPDSQMVAIARGARDANRVELWDIQAGSLRRTIRGFDGPVWSVSFSPDGHTLVTGSGGTHKEKVAEKPTRQGGRWFTELKWWDVGNGELLRRVELPDGEIVSIVAGHSPDGLLLAMVENRLATGMGNDLELSVMLPESIRRSMVASMSGYFEAQLKLIDARTGELRLKLKDGFNVAQVPMFASFPRSEFLALFAGGRRVKPAVFSPDGHLIAAWKPDEARLWDAATGAEVLKIKKFKGRLTSLAFSPDGRLIAGAIEKVSYKDHQAEFKSELRIWEISNGLPKQVFPLKTHSVSSLIFANGQQLLIGGLQFEETHSYASMELVEVEVGSVGKIVANEEGNVSAIALSPDGEALAFQTDASTVKLLTTRGWRTRHTFGADDDTSASKSALSRFLVSVKSVPAVAFLPDGKTVAGAIEAGGVKLWDARTGETKRTLAQESETGSVAAISRNGVTAAEVFDDQTVRVWDLANGTPRNISANQAGAISLSGDGETLAIGETDRILIMSTRQLKATRVIQYPGSQISFLVLSSDGREVAAASHGQVKVWSTDDGVLRQTMAAGGVVSALQFGPANQLAIGRKDGSAGLWSLSRGTINVELRKHSAAINAIAFSADGTLVATGGDDRSAIIWECGTGKARRTLKGHDLAITSLAFSPDGAVLAVGTGNASVVLWQVEKGKLDRVLK